MFITLFTLMTASVPLAQAEPPLHYYQSGTEVVIAVKVPDGGEIVVAAHGKPLGAPLTVQGGQVRFSVPEVRTRTILELRNSRSQPQLVAQVAVYPRQSQLWGEEKITVCALRTPRWFQQWSTAAGIDAAVFSKANVLRRTLPRDDTPKLIVFGRDAPFGHPRDALEYARDCSANILVLDASWYAQRIDEPAAVRLSKVREPLPALGAWSWQNLPPFTFRWRPRLLWMNRAAVAHNDSAILIEFFILPEDSRVLVASYLPWVQNVGRNDSADAFLAELIRETACANSPEPLDAQIAVHPEPQLWPDPLRPVLSRAARTATFSTETGGLQIADLRGEAPHALTARRISSLLDSKTVRPVLILGDDPILRSVRGVPDFDVPKQTSDVAEALWIPADELPPRTSDQEALMRVLTEYGIPIVPHLENNR